MRQILCQKSPARGRCRQLPKGAVFPRVSGAASLSSIARTLDPRAVHVLPRLAETRILPCKGRSSLTDGPLGA